jgi:hypothetical protein
MPERTSALNRIRRWLVIVSLPLAIVLLALWKPDYQPPIFDAQVHYNQNAWQRVRVEAIANGIRELNVRSLAAGRQHTERGHLATGRSPAGTDHPDVDSRGRPGRTRPLDGG